MTDEFSNPRYHADHTTYGGLIYASDFWPDYVSPPNQRESWHAQRITNDLKFDKMCAKNIEGRKYRNKIRKDSK